jgi:hypothetical protein
LVSERGGRISERDPKLSPSDDGRLVEIASDCFRLGLGLAPFKELVEVDTPNTDTASSNLDGRQLPTVNPLSGLPGYAYRSSPDLMARRVWSFEFG